MVREGNYSCNPKSGNERGEKGGNLKQKFLQSCRQEEKIREKKNLKREKKDGDNKYH